MSASCTFYALGSLTHGYGVNDDYRMSEAAFVASVHLGMAGDPEVPWEDLPEDSRKALIRELRSCPGVTPYDLVRLIPEASIRPKP